MQPISEDFKAFIEKEEPLLAQGLVGALELTPPAVSVRLNVRKVVGGSVPASLVGKGLNPVPWCSNGLYLDERPDFTHDPAMHQGLYYVQDASSMIIAHVLRQLAKEPVRYLDACAAPGGKTTAAIDALPDGSLVVANEFDFRRAEILKENVMKWGYPSAVISRGDTVRLRALPGWFDIIAADVPCSGEGMMRKDETARRQWSPGLVMECVVRQREILENLWVALRPGGHLLYSTCTFNRRENEENVQWLIERTGADIVDVPLPGECGIVVRGGMMRFLPTRLRGEGLFLAVLRKPDGSGGLVKDRYKNHGDVFGGKRGGRTSAKMRCGTVGVKAAMPVESCREWVYAEYGVLLHGDEVEAFPGEFSRECAELDGVLDVIHRGVLLGYIKGRNVQPSQSLAMSVALASKAFPRVEVDTATALAYLRREALQGFDAPRGYLLLCYGGHPLGFVNNLGNRANNLYPLQWRIIK